mmetsp:Transcript_5579/g.16648  ORF Transcript_5579/g.16648 Transcript_5579/m.16648 type:complete len:259 (-) Transcript_5579:58-834(-)
MRHGAVAAPEHNPVDEAEDDLGQVLLPLQQREAEGGVPLEKAVQQQQQLLLALQRRLRRRQVGAPRGEPVAQQPPEASHEKRQRLWPLQPHEQAADPVVSPLAHGGGASAAASAAAEQVGEARERYARWRRRLAAQADARSCHPPAKRPATARRHEGELGRLRGPLGRPRRRVDSDRLHSLEHSERRGQPRRGQPCSAAVPDVDHLVGATRDKSGAVRGPGECARGADVRREHRRALARRQVPEADAVVSAARGEPCR